MLWFCLVLVEDMGRSHDNECTLKGLGGASLWLCEEEVMNFLWPLHVA